MLNKSEAGNGTGGKATGPTPTPTPIDAAGLAVEMMSMIPEPHLLPLFYLNLKVAHDDLKLKVDRIDEFLKSKGLHYE